MTFNSVYKLKLKLLFLNLCNNKFANELQPYCGLRHTRGNTLTFFLLSLPFSYFSMSTNYRVIFEFVSGYYQCCTRGYGSLVQHDADIEFIGHTLSSREIIKRAQFSNTHCSTKMAWHRCPAHVMAKVLAEGVCRSQETRSKDTKGTPRERQRVGSTVPLWDTGID